MFSISESLDFSQSHSSNVCFHSIVPSQMSMKPIYSVLQEFSVFPQIW